MFSVVEENINEVIRIIFSKIIVYAICELYLFLLQPHYNAVITSLNINIHQWQGAPLPHLKMPTRSY